MNSETKTSPLAPQTHRRRRWLLRIILVTMPMVLLLSLIFTARPSVEKVVLLTPAALARSLRPGPLTQVKHFIMNTTAPLWRGYWSRRTRLSISSSLLALSAEATDQSGLGAPRVTNSDGLRAWVLPATELRALEHRLKTNSAALRLSGTRVETADGVQACVTVGAPAPTGSASAPVGYTMDVLPNVTSHSIRILAGFLSTTATASKASNGSSVKTNFAGACRAILLNSGGLVVASQSPRNGNGTNYWLILSARAVDARGNPITL